MDCGVIRGAGGFLCVTITFITSLVAVAQSRGAEPNLATQSAVHLLRSAGQIRRNGGHLTLIRALRQLQDPALSPLFEYWADSDQPALQVHGMLGLAQSHSEKKLDFNRLAAIENPVVTAQLVIAAMEAKVLDVKQAQQLLSDKRLDPGVRLLAGLHLAQKKLPVDVSLLDELSSTAPQDHVTLVPMLSIPRSQWTPQELLTLEHQVRQSLAALLKLQQGQPGSVDAIEQAVQAIRNPGRDAVIQMLLASTISYELDQTVEWAYRQLQQDHATRNETVYALALQAALRYGQANSGDLWQRDYAAASGLADRLRWAILLLRTAPWAPADLFTPLIAEEDPLLRAIGQAGQAIAVGQGITASVLDLTKHNHPVINPWAITYAKNRADPQDGLAILYGLITNDPASARQIVAATEALCEDAPDDVVDQLRPLLVSPQTESRRVQAILLGLIQASPESRPGRVIDSLAPFTDSDTKSLALILAAKSGQPLTDQQWQDLQLLVRGGGGVQDALRLQAAWAHLKRAGQTAAAIDQLLRNE